MALPINVRELIESRVVESTRIEYKSDWDPEPIHPSMPITSSGLEKPPKGATNRYNWLN